MVTAPVAYDALDDFGTARPDHLGSHPAEAGLPPGGHESRLALFSALMRDTGGGMVALVTVLGAVVASHG
ncbi:hypothetical protein [Streptomyces sp. NPDC059071]|uniref:hypothetical protein n=1 Tax=unclassified Streptomyces TaxID=2593676 RepID=UPI003626DD27